MKFKVALIFLAILALLFAGPVLIIWSLNTLFPALAIPYTMDTWAAAVILGGLLTSKFK